MSLTDTQFEPASAQEETPDITDAERMCDIYARFFNRQCENADKIARRFTGEYTPRFTIMVHEGFEMTRPEEGLPYKKGFVFEGDEHEASATDYLHIIADPESESLVRVDASIQGRTFKGAPEEELKAVVDYILEESLKAKRVNDLTQARIREEHEKIWTAEAIEKSLHFHAHQHDTAWKQFGQFIGIEEGSNVTSASPVPPVQE